MRPSIRIRPPKRAARPAAPLSTLALLLVLSACGGGGGGGTGADATAPAATPVAAPAQPATAATMSTAMSAFRTNGAMPENFRPVVSLPADAIATAASRLPPSAGATYLKVWTLDPASGQRSMLSFGQWTPGQTLPGIQTLTAARTAYFELYNDAGSATGSWGLQ